MKCNEDQEREGQGVLVVTVLLVAPPVVLDRVDWVDQVEGLQSLNLVEDIFAEWRKNRCTQETSPAILFSMER
jgi:hypothetical protein